MADVWKDIIRIYRREAILSVLFLWMLFQYILNFAQEDIIFTQISLPWGMWCRIMYSTTNTFWFGASYWVLFVMWMREIYVKHTSLFVVYRYGSKWGWSSDLLKKGVLFAVLYPLIHFALLCLVNIYLYGWNRPSMEEEAFQKLFIHKSIMEALGETLFLRIEVSVIMAMIIWILFVLSCHTTITVISSLIFVLISIIMLSFDTPAAFLFFPAGVSFYYLLTGGRGIFLSVSGVLLVSILLVFLIQKFRIQKIEVQQLR